MWFQGFASACTTDDSADTTNLAEGAEAGLAGVTRLGGARVGDKTMVDAMSPAAIALRAAADGQVEPGLALADAALAARTGASVTASYVARRGRASYVGAAAQGVVDPGALASHCSSSPPGPDAMARKVILTVAPTGGFLTKAQTPHVPTQPDEIIEDVVRCHAAGASMVSLHARRTDDRATCDPSIYRALNEGIRAGCDIVLGNSTGGGFDGDLAMPGTGSHWESRVDERSRGCEGGAEVCSVNAMTVLGRADGPHVLMSSTREESRALVAKMAALGVKPEWEAFSPTHLTQDIAALTAEGGSAGPHWVSLCFGLDAIFQGAVGFDLRTLQFMVDQLPADSEFSVTGQGVTQVPSITASILLGGHVRVGIEDARWDARGELRSNMWFVEWATRLIETLGCDVASPAEARQILGLA